MQAVVYKYPNSFGFVIISKELINTLHGFRQIKSNQTEAGGILLGFRRVQHFEIVLCSTPQPNDNQFRFNFVRKDKFHQNFAIKNWKKSNRYMDYIGEWHTHPEPNPTPSSIDVYYWKRLKRNVTDNPMIGLIIGQESDWIGLVSKKTVLPLIKLDP